jgi:hypothetical protein
MKISFKTKTFQQTVKPVSIFLIMYLTCLSIPTGYVSAAMIGTETLVERDRGQLARNYVKGILAKKEVKETLIAQGINPFEAEARVDSLSDAEIMRLAEKINQLPAGGDGLGVLVGAALIVFIVLLITDILGYTNVFPFVS